MAYLAGESLRARMLREPQLPIDEALRITEAIASALQAAHREGVVHRDIKPENIFLADGHVYVVDFGVAKALIETGGERLTSTGLSIGTPAYMSPEQATGDSVDARSDQYSLASVLYEMLTGELPFGGSTPQAMLARRLTEPARTIRAVRSSVPESVEQAVLRGLERAPVDRFADVGAFVAALRTKGAPVTSARRRGQLIAVSATITVVAAAASVFLFARHNREPRQVVRDSAVVALYQRGMRSLAKRTDEGATDALASFRAALERDSTYGAAWAGLAQVYQQAVGRRFVFPGIASDSVLRLAVAASDRAMALDGRNPEVLFTQAIVTRLTDPTNFGPVIKTLRLAAQADPRSPRTWQQLGISLYDSGERDEAIRDWHQAVAIDPSYTEALSFLALGFMWARQYDSALYWADSTLAVDPNYLLGRQAHGYIEVERGNFQRAAADYEAARRLSTGVEVPNSLAGRALVAARAGRKREAAQLLAEVESLMAGYTPVPLHNAVYNAAAYAALGDAPHAVAWLERFSPREGLHFQLHIRCDPALDPIAGDSRFRALLITPRPGPSRGC
jgi:tetratricopeptide (TPR) repeat protein